jgi:branched-chain amino acid transport system permease protein
VEELGKSIVLGVVYGSAYALLALGLVLVYKGSRVFNFAQGEFGTVGAFFVLIFLETLGLPYAVAALFAVTVAVLMGLGVERLVVQPLSAAPKVTILVATAAVALGAIGLELFFADASVRFVPRGIDGTAFVSFGAPVAWQQLLWVLALVVFGGLLFFFFQFTDLGLAVLAASQEPVATDLCGVATRRVSMLVWGFAGLLGGVAGVIVAPVVNLTPGLMTSQFLIFGFIAAVVGGMTSMPGAVVGGLTLGLVEQFTVTYLSDLTTGMSQVSIFALLILVLAVRPTGLLGKEA